MTYESLVKIMAAENAGGVSEVVAVTETIGDVVLHGVGAVSATGVAVNNGAGVAVLISEIEYVRVRPKGVTVVGYHGKPFTA